MLDINITLVKKIIQKKVSLNCYYFEKICKNYYNHKIYFKP